MNEDVKNLATKIKADLPESLSQQLGFQETDAGALKIFPLPKYSKLESADVGLISSIVKRQYGGEYISAEKGIYYWLVCIPKNRDELPPAVPVSEQPSTPTTAPTSTPEPESSAPNDAKPKDEPKQPSPIELFQKRFCDTCTNQHCKSTGTIGKEARKECYTVMHLLFLDDIRTALLTNNKARPFSRNGSNRDRAPAVKETYFLEDGITWANSTTSSEKPCNKAYESKNLVGGKVSDAYLALKAKVQKEKGFGGYFYYLVEKGDTRYIGRVKTAAKEAA